MHSAVTVGDLLSGTGLQATDYGPPVLYTTSQHDPVVLRAEISLSHEAFRRVVRGVRGEAGEALQQQHPSPIEPIMNLWFRLCRAGVRSR